MCLFCLTYYRTCDKIKVDHNFIIKSTNICWHLFLIVVVRKEIWPDYYYWVLFYTLNHTQGQDIMAVVEAEKAMLILMILYCWAVVFGFLASIPMVMHVYPDSECLLFSYPFQDDKLSYGSHVSKLTHWDLHILRLHIFGLFLTHPPIHYVCINRVLIVSKDGHFLNPPTIQSSC